LIDTVIFDFDGTIIDSEWVESVAWLDLYTSMGYPFDADGFAASVGDSAMARHPARRLAATLGRPGREEELFVRWQGRVADLINEEPLRPGIQSWIGDAQQRGLRLGIASSSPRDWVLPHLHRLGIEKSFSAIACGDEVIARKPAPDVYFLALRRLGSSPQRTLAVEDSVSGVNAAAASGCHVVMVPNRLTRNHEKPRGVRGVDMATTPLLATLEHLEADHSGQGAFEAPSLRWLNRGNDRVNSSERGDVIA